MISFITNLSIRSKLFTIIFLPLLGFIYFSGNQLIATYQQKRSLEEMKVLTDSAIVSALLVHELQKERGASAGFLGSKGDKFGDILNKQRQQTDLNLHSLKQFIHKTELPDSLNQLFHRINAEIAKLDNIRQRVDQLAVSVAEEVDFYSQLNGQLLSIIDNTANNSSIIELSISANAIASFLQHKERAGIERAVLSNVFANDNFTPELLVKFIRLLAEQDAYITRFKANANGAQLAIYSATVKGEAVDQVEEYRSHALKNMARGNFDRDATLWFTIITEKINLLKEVEVALLNELQSTNQQLLEKMDKQLITLFLIILLPLIITIMISSWIAAQLHQGINELIVKLKCVVERNDLTTRVQLDSTEELGEIGRTVNQLIEHLQNLVGKIHSTSSVLRSSLSENARHTYTISHQIGAGSVQVTQVAAATTQMISTVAEIARNANNAANETEKATTESNHGNHEVEETIRNINQLSAELNNASTVIGQLNAASSNISKFLNVIKDISERTNLLALNAAIEAARAGDSGRGFAVVADEVRSLAIQTKESTKEIESMISELQAQSKSAQGAMQKGINMVDKSVQDALQTGKDITHVTSCIRQLNQINEQVATAAEEQNKVTEEINRNMVNIQEGYSDMITSFSKIEKGTVLLEQLSEDLNQAVEQFIIR